MISNKLSMTAQNPSCFGMPTRGHAFAATLWGTDLGAFGTSMVTRDRQATLVKGGKGLVPTYIPGTTAWSPPTS